jgi:hypothetical protein
MPTKLELNGNSVTVWWALPNYAQDPANPTAAEINNSQELTCAISFEGWSFGASASNQISDPALCDVGNVQTRGYAQFGGQISFFYPNDYTDLTNEYANVFAALMDPHELGYIIIRVDGQKTTSGVADAAKPAVTNDIVSIYKVISDGWTNEVTAENSYRYTINFRPQGVVYVNAVVGAASVSTPAPVGATAYTIGGKTPLTASINGRTLYSDTGVYVGTPGWLTWTSDDPAASVDSNGVVTGVSGGSADIVATDPISGKASTPLSITIT